MKLALMMLLLLSKCKRFKPYKPNEAKKKNFYQIRLAMEKALLYGKMFALVVLYDGDNDYDVEEVKCIRVSS